MSRAASCGLNPRHERILSPTDDKRKVKAHFLVLKKWNEIPIIGTVEVPGEVASGQPVGSFCGSDFGKKRKNRQCTDENYSKFGQYSDEFYKYGLWSP